jgi:CRISPR-associated exonuclease Cas4
MIEIIIAVMFAFALFLLLYSALSSGKAKEIKTKYRIPEGKITYTDLDKPAKALYSRRFNLAGKPDYIVKRGDEYIPVEVKNTNAGRPYDSHIMQLASYCLLLEDGLLAYNNGQFKIPFDDGLRNRVKGILETIRNEIRSGKVERNHSRPNRCINCSLRKFCEFRLS